ncbi:MAG: sulfatase-like hydrolase/transferase [Pyrinomonadaceae bacterium]
MTDQKAKKITRRGFVGGAIGASAAGAVWGSPVKAAGRPNILFILADDMGWADLSCYGRPDYRTPNLDELARQGVRFTNAYAAAPVCTPTRVGFHTGRYPARLPVGLEEPIHERKALSPEELRTIGIPRDHPTVSSLIRSAGYATALVGKWHVGYLPYFGPLKCGYDEFYGNMSGAVDHFTHKDMTGSLDFFEDEVPVERIGYMTDLLTNRAVEYIRRPHKKPFYLSLHYTAPHWPWEGPKDIAVSNAMKHGPVGFRAGGSLKTYAEMMKSLDEGIGQVLAALKAAGLDKNTLVIFTSDNGGERFSFNWPFKGQKHDLYEGGVRVPAIVRWPGVQRKPGVTDQPVITMDWTATMIAAAGAKPDPSYQPDGQDMTPVIAGTKAIYDRTFFWRTYRQGAVRSGTWKYIREGKLERLHDLSIDEHEEADFKGSQASTLERLRGLFNKWENEMQRYPTS